jgi:SAM-dependent methyltransferase
MFSPTPTVSADEARLARRLRQLGRVFRIAEIRAAGFGAAEVIDYYDQCHGAYRKHHSAEGAMHMALNSGDRFDPAGFYGALRRIESTWREPPGSVLELGFGQGFNLADLGGRYPQTRFAGIDLTPAHLTLAEHRMATLGLQNVQLQLGDLHHLPYPDASFDRVFAIEVFCHAMDVECAFAEVARVLRPGGTFTVFDGYVTRPLERFSVDEALAVELIAKGMAIDRLQWLAEIQAQAQRSGFVPDGLTVLDAEVMPTLRRLERLTGAVIRFPWLGRRALARRSPMRGRNVLAGCLLRIAVSLGLLGYRQIAWQKAMPQ